MTLDSFREISVDFSIITYFDLFTCDTCQETSEVLIQPMLTLSKDLPHFNKTIFALSSEAGLKSLLLHKMQYFPSFKQIVFVL